MIKTTTAYPVIYIVLPRIGDEVKQKVEQQYAIKVAFSELTGKRIQY
ncbi:MAG TPA: hypothetical protein VJ765_10720 [Chitinophagaceae bacterium]|nr:hypothetical protein [Chitinophagaceae bacterium]